jgi:hypothetical protein
VAANAAAQPTGLKILPSLRRIETMNDTGGAIDFFAK